METPNEPRNEKQEEEEITLDKNNPDSIYNWVAHKISGPSFRNIIKDFIDDNCSLFIDVEENTFQQGQIFNEFNQLLENILSDVLEEGGLTQEQFLEAAQRGLEDKKYKKYFDQLLNFSDYNFFKRCMTKRNYTLIKRFEEQMAQQKKEIEEQQLEEKKKKELEKLEAEKGLENDKYIENGKEETNKGENKEKTEKEIEEERQRQLLYQMLNQEEEQELQEVIKQSLALEEKQRRIAVIEEEELNRALKQSLLEAKKQQEKEEAIKKEEPKKEEKKKPDYQISKNENFGLENQPKEVKPIPPPKKPITFIASSSNSFQFSGSIPNKEENIEKPTNIISANKGFDFQIQSNNNNFGISSQNPLPEEKKENLIEENKKEEIQEEKKEEPKEKRERKDIEYKDIIINENKKPETQKVEIQRKKEEIKEKKIYIYDNYNDKDKNNKKEQNIIEIDDNPKDDNFIITNEIRTKPNPQPPSQPKIPEPESQKASDILKQTMEENKINDNYIKDDSTQNDNNDFGGYDRLLISDDEDEEEKKEEKKEINIVQKPLSNAFIDAKKDINLGKVRTGKDGGNFLNNFSDIKNFKKGGIEKLETKLKQEQFQSVITNPNEDDDYLAKLKEVEKEKNQKLKEYREKLIKMQKEKRENKAKETLSLEELIKLQRREQLAERLKAKRMKENNQ